MEKILEICVDSIPSALSAQTGGADRIELCENLDQGGVTPSAAKIVLAKQVLKIPVFVLIRPRKGDFLYDYYEFETLIQDIKMAKEMGADGIVSGALTKEGYIDKPKVEKMIGEADPLPFTFHRAFDMCQNPFEDLDWLADAGVERVLTSGRNSSVIEGLDTLKALTKAAPKNLKILACADISPDEYPKLLEIENLSEFHTSARHQVKSKMTYKGNVPMGSEALEAEFNWYEADGDLISKLRKTLDAQPD